MCGVGEAANERIRAWTVCRREVRLRGLAEIEIVVGGRSLAMRRDGGIY
jgi:hypothetical protein